MSESTWEPSQTDMFQSQQAYLRYATGIALLNNPPKFGIGNRSEIPALVNNARSLMIESCRKMIQMASAPEQRESLEGPADNYDQALPHLQATVSQVYDIQLEPLRRLSPLLESIRPMAVSEQAIYRQVCAGHLGSVSLQELMDGVWLAPAVAAVLDTSSGVS